jgi:hypothetical protein
VKRFLLGAALLSAIVGGAYYSGRANSPSDTIPAGTHQLAVSVPSDQDLVEDHKQLSRTYKQLQADCKRHDEDACTAARSVNRTLKLLYDTYHH